MNFMDKVSKRIIQQINKEMRKWKNVNQWNDSQLVQQLNGSVA